ncbi:MAG: spermidine/putrescine ABC transporter substrate-binding protein [Acidimicrobiia bacterium]|nr:spermidine/putrescine ABC transporter substrate-binding protein [Acidimicrobiia bacterium]NNC43901.1 spermidine/putrescine ABC transporter substrate-binding protein [Acidimicrobiia bacterium]
MKASKTRYLRGLAALVALSLVATACGGDSGDGDLNAQAAACEPGQVDGDLSFYNWAEYIDPDLITAFEAEYGIDVEYTEYESNESMLAQVEAGGAVYDLVVPSDYMVDTMRQEDLLVEINRAAVPNAVNVGAPFENPPYDPEGKFSLPYQWGTTGIGVSYAALEALGMEDAPSWGMIFDPEMSSAFAGRISMLDDAPEAISAALKYLGYSIVDVIESNNEAAVMEAGALLKATNERLAKYDSVNFGDDLVNGEVDIAHGWSGGFFLSFDEADAWEDYAYVIPVEGGVRWVDNMSIPKTAVAVCSAHTMMDFLLDAERGAQLTNWTFYASPNEAATPFITEDIIGDPAIYPPPEVEANLELIPNQGELALVFQDQFTQAKG